MCTAKTGRVLGSLGVLQCLAIRKCSRYIRATAIFGSTAIKGTAKTERAFGPLGMFFLVLQ